MPRYANTSLWLLVVVIFFAPAYAAIYKSVDEDGNVTFSDTPPDKNAEEVNIHSINTIPSPNVPPRTSDTLPADEESNAEVIPTSLTIVAPTPDEAVRANNGDIQVSLSANPAIPAGAELIITLDGNEIWRGVELNATLNNVPRGTHSIGARIENSDGGVVATAPSVEFHVLRVIAGGALSLP